MVELGSENRHVRKCQKHLPAERLGGTQAGASSPRGQQEPGTACCHLPSRTRLASLRGLPTTVAHLSAPKQPGASPGARCEERPAHGQLCRALRAGRRVGRPHWGSPAACSRLGGTSKHRPEDPEMVLLQQLFPASKRQ